MGSTAPDQDVVLHGQQVVGRRRGSPGDGPALADPQPGLVGGGAGVGAKLRGRRIVHGHGASRHGSRPRELAAHKHIVRRRRGLRGGGAQRAAPVARRTVPIEVHLRRGAGLGAHGVGCGGSQSDGGGELEQYPATGDVRGVADRQVRHVDGDLRPGDQGAALGQPDGDSARG